MSTTRRSPLRMALPLLAVLVLIALWSAYWLIAFRTARHAFAVERARLLHHGFLLNCGSETWGGFPFRFEFFCGTVHADIPGFGMFETGAIRAVAQAYQPWHIILMQDGPTTVTPNGAPPLTATHQRVIASLTLSNPAEPVLTVEIPKLSVATLLTAQTTIVSLRPKTDGIVDIATSTTAATLTLPGRAPLYLDQASLDATLTSRHSLDIHAGDARQGALIVNGKGSLSLDPQHRPQGEIAAQTNNSPLLFDNLQKYFNISPEERATALAMLAVMGQKAVLTARDGQLTVGPLHITHLPPLY
jgi:hypothetical protein